MRSFFPLLTILILSLAITFFPFPKVKASTTEKFYPTLDGYITYTNGVYSSVDTSSTWLVAGEYYDIEEYDWNRAFLRFNLSSIPDDSEIDSATFFCYYYTKISSSTSEGVINLDEVNDIGDTLTSADWSSASVVAYGQFVGRVTTYQYYNLSVINSVQANDTFISFRLKDSIEDSDSRYWCWYFYSVEKGTNEPYLEVTYSIPEGQTYTVAHSLTIDLGLNCERIGYFDRQHSIIINLDLSQHRNVIFYRFHNIFVDLGLSFDKIGLFERQSLIDLRFDLTKKQKGDYQRFHELILLLGIGQHRTIIFERSHFLNIDLGLAFERLGVFERQSLLTLIIALFDLIELPISETLFIYIVLFLFCLIAGGLIFAIKDRD